jgi:predicted PurR-regulated permease PerM
MDAPARTSHRVLVGLALAAIALTIWLIRPFWVALFLGAVFAGALRRPMNWLTRKLRGRRSLAGVLLTLAVLFAIVIPVGGLGTLLVTELLAGIGWVREVLTSQGFNGLVQRLPHGLQDLARRAVEALPDLQTQLEKVAGAGGQAAAAAAGAVAATTQLLFQGAMMLIALYFFLTDGRRLVAWIDAYVPMKTGQLTGLLEEFRRTAASVLWASVATALIQTAAGTVGYLIARAPVPLFLAFATFVVALVPAVGGTVVVVLVGVLQLVTGHLLSGIFLIAWALVVVGIVDNFARPYLLKGGMELHGGIVFFALLGGIAAFGAIGLIVGPLIVTFLMAVMKMYRTDLEEEGVRVS